MNWVAREMIINEIAAAIQKMARSGKNFNRQASAHRRGLCEALGAAAFAVLHQGQSVRVEEMIGEGCLFQFCILDATIIFQEMPKRSITIPYRSAKKVFSKGI